MMQLRAATRCYLKWPDINYADRSMVPLWDPQRHLDRLAQMVIAYENHKSPLTR
jgi:hypothetical protein